MTDYDRMVDRYVAMWNEADAEKRKRLIAELGAMTACTPTSGPNGAAMR
ncbi:MAG: hypothetical protein ABI439_05160 [Rhodospirillales bacterium]